MLKVALIGNCQMDIVSKMLLTSQTFNSKYIISYNHAIHKITNEEMINFINNILPELSLLIYQPITDTYRSKEGNFSLNYIKSKLHINCKLIVIPNSYFTGYFPEMVYIKDRENKNISKYGIDYHDKNIINRFVKNPDDKNNCEVLLRQYNSLNYYTKHYSEKIVDISLQNLIRREKSCDIIISDFIKKNYKKYRLFHTLNHPTKKLLQEVSNRVLENLGLKRDVNYDDEVLNSVIFPIYNSTYYNLNLIFDSGRNYHMKKETIQVKDGINKFLYFYGTCISFEILYLNHLTFISDFNL